ncbi:hypothetical protein G3578_03035 [Brevibacillus sp. SYP-B805]|uniref:hypothetical protein n=1 Tax=Brevibacillus sp. SYP-B805 TaxID=1578199 RepID=UPI0013EB33F5|nr:hypothetical protein [Brevibacillus sp. SYP-B805]NGQ94148.1 hypothetical protein [Brevibacillus sp. SYP-B805]
MDVEQSLRHLKETADATLLRDRSFTPEMERRVWERIRRKGRRKGGFPFSLLVPAAVALAILAVSPLLAPAGPPFERETGQPHKETEPILPGAVWHVPTLWKPSPSYTESYGQHAFTYYGTKPVRIMTEEFYEGQAQKVMWLLNGAVAKEVQIVAVNEQGVRKDLGTWEVGGRLYDADAHFPSSIVLPEPGIWKLQVLSGGKHFGLVFVEVKPGVSPANRSLVEPLITRYLQSHKDFGGGSKENRIGLELLGMESPDAEHKTVYAWVSVLAEEPYNSSGVDAPARFDIAFDGSSYRVVGHRLPAGGEQYWPSIEQMFPAKVVEKIKERVRSN